MSRLKGLLGRTPRQRILRAAELVAFLAAMGMLVFWFAVGSDFMDIEERPIVTIYYWPMFTLLLVVWLVLAILDLREGLKDIAQGQR
jgi:hypothetical protein